MTTTGVTPQGFVPKVVTDLLTDIEQAQLSTIAADFDVSPANPIGQVNGIFANKLAELWELAGVCYNGMNRDTAENVQLDNVNGLTGTPRKTALPSNTAQTCVFSQVGTYAATSLVANVSGQPSVQFASIYDVVVSLSGVYSATQNGVILATSATLPLTVPGVKFVCTVSGPTVANAGTLSVISTPVSGWTSTTNPLDATLGSLVEQDTAYRLRGALEIAAAGSGNPDAIRADVLNVPGVLQDFIIENTSDVVDAYSNPPHSMRAVIWDGPVPQASDSAIAQALWNDKPSGIPYVGNVLTGTALDSNGVARIVPFNRATQNLLYLVYTVTMLPGVVLSTTQALAMKQAIVAATLAPQIKVVGGTVATNPAYLGLGNTVGAEAMKSALMQAGLGVFDVTALQLGFAPSPAGITNLAVGLLAIALADTSRITINGL